MNTNPLDDNYYDLPDLWEEYVAMQEKALKAKPVKRKPPKQYLRLDAGKLKTRAVIRKARSKQNQTKYNHLTTNQEN